MVMLRTSSIRKTSGTDTLNDVWSGTGFVLFGVGLVFYWLFHPHNSKILAGGLLLIVLGIYFLRRAWRLVLRFRDRLNLH